MATNVTRFLKDAALLGAIVLGSLLAGCGGGGGSADSGTGSDFGTGTLRLALTDTPACGYDAVHVTVQKIRVHKSDSAGDADAGWSEVVLQPQQRIDLLTLTNGVLYELGQTALPAGKYTQMRLVLAPNDNANPRANAVTPSGSTETALSTPSAVESGLKLNINIDVPSGQVADFVLDFDACRSIVKAGNSGRYNLKPVISVIPRLGVTLIGYGPSALIAKPISVSAQQGGVPVRTTIPDSAGKFVLAPLPAGTYDIVIVAQDRATATVTGVPVPATGEIMLNTAATAINPPPSPMFTVSGKVTVVPLPTSYDALVVARKAYTGGPTVEVAGGPVDAVSGEFLFSLPAAAPVKAPYTTTPPFVFTTDGAVPTGIYTLYATAGGATKSVSGVNVSSGDVPNVLFSFP